MCNFPIKNLFLIGVFSQLLSNHQVFLQEWHFTETTGHSSAALHLTYPKFTKIETIQPFLEERTKNNTVKILTVPKFPRKKKVKVVKLKRRKQRRRRPQRQRLPTSPYSRLVKNFRTNLVTVSDRITDNYDYAPNTFFLLLILGGGTNNYIIGRIFSLCDGTICRCSSIINYSIGWIWNFSHSNSTFTKNWEWFFNGTGINSGPRFE